MLKLQLVAVLLLLQVGGCDLPRDPERTLERVRGGTMRVGITENAPWAAPTPDGAEGVEVRLVEDLARDLGARVVWTPGSETELLEALEKRELDLVIGGLTSPSPWEKQIGLTRPYHMSRVFVGAPPGAAPQESVRGVRVGVERGSVVAAELEKRGAVPVPVEDLTQFPGPVAAPEYELARRQYRPGLKLTQEEHVMAVPPGENGWLVHLEQYLERRQPEVGPMLQDAKR